MNTHPEQRQSYPNKPDLTITRPYLSVKEATAVLGVCRNTVYAGLHSGRIPHLRLNKKFLIPREALLNLAMAQRDCSDAEAMPR